MSRTPSRIESRPQGATEADLGVSDLVADTEADLRVSDLVARYGDVVAVDHVSFSVPQGQFVALLGPSGCGKTTTLRCIAGLEDIAGGRIEVGGRTVAGPGISVPAHKRDINMVFQSYAVWPHLSVAENVAYGLKVKRLPKAEIRSRVEKVLKTVGLEEYAARFGTELSGGQQQRVAVARAIVTEPRVLLLDEPLSNLDAALRVRMRVELLELQRQLGRTAIYVTHDQDEAMAMADLIILMNKGRIEQVGDARSLYEHPASLFAAHFVGRANEWRGTVLEVGADHARTVIVRLDDGRVCSVAGSARTVQRGEGVAVVVRPEALEMSAAETPDATTTNRWPATLERVTYLGSLSECVVRSGATRMEVTARADLPFGAGSDVTLSASPDKLWIVSQDAATAVE